MKTLVDLEFHSKVKFAFLTVIYWEEFIDFVEDCGAKVNRQLSR